MKKFIVGTKQNMVQFFQEDGKCVPATFIDAGPMVVTQVKTVEKDGYNAVQVGVGSRRLKNIANAQKGHIAKAIPNPGPDVQGFALMKEFRVEDVSGYTVGDIIDITVFAEGDKVAISGVSKGKGFQGVVKRHGFHGGPRSHGQKHSEREPGSIGATGPQRVFKGMRMGGRMGSDRVQVKNLHIIGVDAKNNKILISGALPGKRGTFIEVVQ